MTTTCNCWVIKPKSKNCLEKIIILNKKYSGISNAIKKLDYNLLSGKYLKDDFYYLTAGNKYRMVYKILKENNSAQIIDLVHRTKLHKIKNGNIDWPPDWL